MFSPAGARSQGFLCYAESSREHPPHSAWRGIIRSNESSHFHAPVVMGSDTEGVGIDKGLA